MEEKDPIENKFKSSFSGYEKEPPARVWENLQKELHPDPNSFSHWSRIPAITFFTNRPLGFYLTVGGITISLFVTMFYLGYKGHHTIRGHAYAGEVRLRQGTAALFQVADKTMPWDSATHYRSAILDIYGHFQFSKVRAGKYLLRVAPDEYSEEAKRFIPTWFDRHENSDSCNLIVIDNDDVNEDVRLVLRSEAARQ